MYQRWNNHDQYVAGPLPSFRIIHHVGKAFDLVDLGEVIQNQTFEIPGDSGPVFMLQTFADPGFELIVRFRQPAAERVEG